jgi:hypothetical protein
MNKTVYSPLMTGDGAETAAQCRREIRNNENDQCCNFHTEVVAEAFI